jgi:hypothetical protein
MVTTILRRGWVSLYPSQVSREFCRVRS